MSNKTKSERFVWAIGHEPRVPEAVRGTSVIWDTQQGLPVLTLHEPWGQLICLESTREAGGAPLTGLCEWINGVSNDCLASEGLPVTKEPAVQQDVQPLPQWAQEFSPDYCVPHLITDALIDESWRNDGSPEFVHPLQADLACNAPNRVTLWCEHPDPKKREHEGERFLVVVNGEDGEPVESLELQTDDAQQALNYVRSQVNALIQRPKVNDPREQIKEAGFVQSWTAPDGRGVEYGCYKLTCKGTGYQVEHEREGFKMFFDSLADLTAWGKATL